MPRQPGAAIMCKEHQVAQGPSRLESVISLAKRRGFVFPCGEIYGGTRSAWDYGPLGVELKENIKKQWWQYMVRGREDVVGLDSSVILPRETWVASGHVKAFTDPLVESLHTHKRYRADQLIEEYAERKGLDPDTVTLDMVPDPVTGQPGAWTEPRSFSGLLKTYLGPVDDEAGLHYLRPETAQGIFVNYANVAAASHKKPPFGIGQIGKSFRNEITPGNFIFRTREFEQMELEFFCAPGTDEEWHQYWIDYRRDWYVGLGIDPDNLRFYEHPQEKLSHYSKRTVDIEYRFGFQGSEWGELEGIANRTDFDLSTHSEHSGSKLDYFDQQSGERWTPYVIEPSAGLTRPSWLSSSRPTTRTRPPTRRAGSTSASSSNSIRASHPSRSPSSRSRARNSSRDPRRNSPRSSVRSGTSSTTMPEPSAAATAARTKSAPRTA